MNIMRCIYLAILISCLTVGPAIAADLVPILPDPLELEWDISKKNSVLVQDFFVAEYDPYNIFLRFEHTHISKDEVQEIFKFTGDGSRGPYDLINKRVVTWQYYNHLNELNQKGMYEIRYGHPGVMIPIYIKIEKIDDRGPPSLVIEQTYNTVGIAGGYKGGLQREICSVKLKPGKYRITANTIQKTDLPPSLPETFLDILTPPKTLPLSYSE